MSRTLLAFVIMLGCGCGRPAPADIQIPTRAEIWAAIQPDAERYRLEPTFVYALVAAESNFDPRARRGDVCGLLQLSPGAWRTVSERPYDPIVWEWRANLAVGIDYLAHLRSELHRKTTFSYPKLAAAFHHGPAALEGRGFDERRLPVPDNPIFQELWRGNLAPVEPPR